MELLHRLLGRYAVFEVASETEALTHIGEVTAQIYESPPRIIGFNEDGYLVSEQQVEEQGEGDDWRSRNETEEYEDDTVTLSRYAGGSHLLAIELFNDFEDPNDPLYADNIVLARGLERLCRPKA